MSWLYELHRGLPRQGPGDDASTRRALAWFGELPLRPRILDLGCGPGMQTLELARSSGGRVVAVDNHVPFLEELRRRAAAAGLARRIEILEADLHALELPEPPFDLVWSEGAIYVVGLEEGLRGWREFLRPDGPLAVSELTWLGTTPPEPCRRFFEAAYPPMTDVAGNLDAARRSGYEVVGSFALPEAAWWRHYYEPLESRLDAFEHEHGADPDARELVEQTRSEIDMFRRYSAHYGYVFYGMRRRD